MAATIPIADTEAEQLTLEIEVHALQNVSDSVDRQLHNALRYINTSFVRD